MMNGHVSVVMLQRHHRHMGPLWRTSTCDKRIRAQSAARERPLCVRLPFSMGNTCHANGEQRLFWPRMPTRRGNYAVDLGDIRWRWHAEAREPAGDGGRCADVIQWWAHYPVLPDDQ